MRERITGVWMWPESVLSGGEKAFGVCAANGVTDVYFLTKGLSGRSAFLSPLTPPSEEGRDILSEALALAHKRGMRLHAWFTSASDAAYKAAHPESGLYHIVRGRDRDAVSMTDEAYIEYMRAIMTDLLARYDVDGIHLDYVRFNHLTSGWSEEDMRLYGEKGADAGRLKDMVMKTFYGDSPQGDLIFDAYRRGDPDVEALARARRGIVIGFASSVIGAARTARKGIQVSAALMPEGALEDLAFSDLHYGQNYADLAPYFDAFLPMAYSQAYGKDENWVAAVARGTIRRKTTAVIGVQSYDGGTTETLEKDVRAALSVPASSGVCLFREGTALWREAAENGVLQRALSGDRGGSK